VVGPWQWSALVALVLADLWLLLSLAVSHVIYDRSDVARGAWLGPATASSVAVFHFGQDEASALVARTLPAAQRQTFDLYDPQRSGSPSLRRARALATAKAAATTAALDRLPLADGSLDLGVLAFAAHEIRDEGTRVALFRELARVLDASGRLLVLEHPRDAWNLLAYGPGAFHFLSRRTWLHTYTDAGLTVVHESRLTPWICRFELRRTT
jgi:SAM-dependent methyltransferase